MNHENVRRYLDLVSKPPYVDRKYVGKSWSKDNFSFNFKYLILNYDAFPCSDSRYHKNGKSLLKIIETLIVSSKDTKFTIDSKKHCHDVKEQKLIEKNLEPLVNKFRGKKFFQFGIDGYKERIVGFFNDDDTHLFEVCILDLNHDIFPMTRRRVFA